nr:MAG: pIIIa protein [unidentified adenovirus]
MQSQPKANRIETILESIVPSRKDPTSTKVFAIVHALLKRGVIRKDEVGSTYCAILQRVAKYNSLNVQSNLDTIVQDIAISNSNLQQQFPITASLVVFNAFLKTLPAVIGKGQNDYQAIIGALKALISETRNAELYKSGPSFFLNTFISGSQTVNLTKAFSELQEIWKLKTSLGSALPVTSLLSTNSRLFLVLISPFVDVSSLTPDSYISFIMKLYKGTFVDLTDNVLQGEIKNISKGITEKDSENIQQTLNFLLTNTRKRDEIPSPLTPAELMILRRLQQTVKTLLSARPNLAPSHALDIASSNLEQEVYLSHMNFVNSLFDYMHKAAAFNQDYFMHTVLNKHWVPPSGFRIGEFNIPTSDNWLWDEEDDLEGAVGGQEEEHLGELKGLLEVKDNNVKSERKKFETSMDDLTKDMENWTTYRQFQESLQGTGAEFQLFQHLKPRGV